MIRQRTCYRVLSCAALLACGGGDAPSQGTSQASDRPAPRFGHQMVFDAARNHVIVFGGSPSTSARSPLADTWAWNGTTWTKLHATGPGRMDAQMVYDADRRRVVLFGGSGDAGANLADTWEWDGVAWSRVATDGPGTRVHATMAYDAERRRVVLHGGYGPSAELTDTWEWDGTRWERRSAVGPANMMALGYDVVSKRVVGLGVTGNSTVTGMWAWSGTAWARLTLPTLPTAEPPIRMLHHDALGLILLNGAFRESSPTTWTWNGSTWSTVGGAPPSRRIGFDIAYDVGRARTVLFGGLAPGETALGDVWELAPNGWTQISRPP